MSSSELVMKGRWFLLTKQLLECRYRFAPIPPGIAKRAEDTGLDLSPIHKMTTKELRKEVHRRYQELWDAQKNGEELRYAWLQERA